MELTSAKTIKELLEKYQARPSKTMGQNFLIDKHILQKIIDAAALTKKDTALEIGPGIGTLTQALAGEAKKVIAIEKDRVMVEILKETLAEFKNVEVLQGDVLAIQPNLPKNYTVVANVPYYITSPIIRMFLEAENPPKQLTLMVQKEVAQRICAAPPDMSLLAVSVQFYATPKIISYVSGACFWPSPKVDSAILQITPFARDESISPDRFFEVVKAGFSHPRKQLAGNLSKELKKSKEEASAWLIKNNLKPQQRAETLAIQDWIALAHE